ncbi:MAG: DUF1269 domain-containing protein [Gammaproteobacteria bacterium]|nr:DUF1269 domain-containing protein [Gammaproteobacteria bacterium]
MLKRLYYVLPDVSRATHMFHDLLLAQVEARRIHVMAKPGVDLGDMPEAGLNQRTDVLHGAVQGIVSGGATGAALGLYLYQFPPEGMLVPMAAILLMALLGASFGAWAASLIGLDVPNTQLERFEKAIDQGKVLMMIDVSRQDMKKIETIIHNQDPDAVAKGVEPTMPAFP